jgi:DNA topoisomerase-3
MDYSFFKKKESIKKDEEEGKKENDSDEISSADPEKVIKAVSSLRKGSKVDFTDFKIKAGETSPPKRYNSGSIILAMENAGQLIDDDELRNEIKGRGIGTSATRAEILKKLVKNAYLNLNKKTQIITPTLTGEIIYDIVDSSMSPMLNPELTASWEKGLGMVENGEISPEEYFSKLKSFVVGITNRVRPVKPGSGLNELFKRDASFYKK